MTARPGPAELYAQAEAEAGPRPRADLQHSKQAWQAKVRDRYRQLMIENGHLIYGEPQPLSCGWTPTTPKENPMTVATVAVKLLSSNGDQAYAAQQVLPAGVDVTLPISLVDAHGVTWQVQAAFTDLPAHAVPDSSDDPFGQFGTLELAEELLRRMRDRAEIDAEYDDWSHEQDELPVTDVPVAGERL